MTPQELKDLVLQHSYHLLPSPIVLIDGGVRFTCRESDMTYEVKATILLGLDSEFYILEEEEGGYQLVYTIAQYRAFIAGEDGGSLAGISYQHWVDTTGVRVAS